MGNTLRVPDIAEPSAPSEDDDPAQVERAQLEALVRAGLWAYLDDKGLWLPNGVSVETMYAPVESVGGDFVGTMADGDRAVAYVGDVAGHGLDAALCAVTAKAEIAEALDQGAGVAEAANHAHETLSGDGGRLATLFVCSVEGDRLDYVNAGQVSPLVFGEEIGELTPTGPVLGATDHEYEAASLELRDATRLVAFTDGVTDAYGADGGLTTAEVVDLVGTAGNLASLVDAVDAKREEPVRDDIAGFELSVPDP